MILFVVFVLCMTALLITFCLGALYISKKYGKWQNKDTSPHFSVWVWRGLYDKNTAYNGGD